MPETRSGPTKYDCLAVQAYDKRRSAGAENLGSLRGAREDGHAPTPREVGSDSVTRGRRGFSVASPGLQRTWSDPWRPGWGRRPRKRDRAPARRRHRETTRNLGGASTWRRETEPAAASFGAPTGPARTDVRSVRAPGPGPGGPHPRSLGPRGVLCPGGPPLPRREGGRLRRPVRGLAATPTPGSPTLLAGQAKPVMPDRKPPKGSAILGCRRRGTLHQTEACEATALAATRRFRVQVKTSRLAGRQQQKSSPPR